MTNALKVSHFVPYKYSKEVCKRCNNKFIE